VQTTCRLHRQSSKALGLGLLSYADPGADRANPAVPPVAVKSEAAQCFYGSCPSSTLNLDGENFRPKGLASFGMQASGNSWQLCGPAL